MIVAINPELYELTERGRNTLRIEPFWGTRTLTVAIGSNSGSVDVEIPQDRICCAETMQFALLAEPTTCWVNCRCSWRPGGSPTSDEIIFCQRQSTRSGGAGSGIVPDNGWVAPTATDLIGLGGTFNLIDRHLTFPPGGILRFFVQRGTPGAATAVATAIGYFTAFLIPAGTMGRVS